MSESQQYASKESCLFDCFISYTGGGSGDWMVPLPSSTVKYHITGNVYDKYHSQVPGGKTTVVSIQEGSNGTVTWALDLDQTGVDSQTFITEVGRFIYYVMGYHPCLCQA